MNKRAVLSTVQVRWLPALAALVAAAVLWPCAPAIAEDVNPPEVEDLRIGFDNQYKAAHWAPVEITLRAGSKPVTGQLRLILPDGDGTPSVVTAPRPIQLLPGRSTKVLLYAKFGQMYGELRVVLRADGSNVIDRGFDTNGGPDRIVLPSGLQAHERLIITLGASIGVEEAARLHQQASGDQITVAALRGPNDLPTEWYGYDGVDCLVISTSQPQMFSQMLDTGSRRAALEKWIEMGGKLVLVAGEQAPVVLAADAPLAGFAPGRFVEPTTLRRTTTLEGFVGGSRKVRAPQDRELALPVPRLADVAGRVEVADGNLPLIVRTPRKFGEIVFVAVDLDRRPLVDWEGRGSLVGRLLDLREPGAAEASAQAAAAAAARQGRSDLGSELRSGLDSFRGVTPISFAVVAAMILGYIILIGPGDYFLVKRVLKRMELTWITFPLWVVLVSGGAYALAVYTKGDDLRVNQADLVDVDVESGFTRNTTWLNVFSPRSQTFDLALQPRSPAGQPVNDSSRLLSWMGAATSGIGNSGSLFSGRYDFSPQLDELIRVPIQVWSTKAFFSRASYQTTEMPTANLTQGPDGVPEGTLRNELPVELQNCTLLSGRWAYVLGNLKPAASVRLRPGEQRDLEHVLRHPGQWQVNNSMTPYGQTPRAVITTLEELMFYRAAGGYGPRGNSDESHRFIDLSHLLPLNRAILVATVAQPAAQLTNSGQDLAGPEDQHWTMYRFVFPVGAAKSEVGAAKSESE